MMIIFYNGGNNNDNNNDHNDNHGIDYDNDSLIGRHIHLLAILEQFQCWKSIHIELSAL